MPVLRLLDGELELFEQSLLQPDAVRYLWKNAGSQFGVIFAVQELEALLGRIGSNPAWDWIWLRKEFDDGRWTQACGRADDGLIVEVDGPRIVAELGARHRPLVNVGTETWRYMAATAETHSIPRAAELQIRWLDDERVGSQYETRKASRGVPRLG